MKDNGDGTRSLGYIDGKEVAVPTTPERIADLWHANNQVVPCSSAAEEAGVHLYREVPGGSSRCTPVLRRLTRAGEAPT